MPKGYYSVYEFFLAFFVIYEFFKLKKQKSSFNEILGYIFNFFNENIKFWLDFIKKERSDITSIRSLNLFKLALLVLGIVSIFFSLIKLLKNCLDRNNIECEKEGTNLLNEEENTEIKKINELRDIN